VSGFGHLPRASAVRSVAPELGSGWLVGVPVRIRRATEVPIVIILLGRDGRSRLWTGGRMNADSVQPVLRPNHHRTHGIDIVEVNTDRHGTSATRHDFPFDRNGTNRIAGRVDRRLCAGTRQCPAHRQFQPPAPSGAK